MAAMRQINPSRPNAYTGGTLDRAGHLRDDDAWIQSALTSPNTRFIPFWRGKALLEGLENATPKATLLPPPAPDAPWVFLGLQNQTPLFALDLSATETPAPMFTELRGLAGALTPDDATILATARAMLHWRAKHLFCGVCGAPTPPHRGGYVLHCTGCATEHFPRTDNAVIMLVTRGNKALLGQSIRFPVERNMYSTLAGFVEPGESLEDAVRREVFEEVGVRVGDVSYHSSQPWPFPASLMLGYYAEALTEEITLQADEMRDANWFTREDIANRKSLGFNIPPHDSIARLLIDDWLNQ